MQQVSESFSNLRIADNREELFNSRLFRKASSLIGKEDAKFWFQNHRGLFTHPRFTEAPIRNERDVRQEMWRLNYDDNTIWAHTHWNWLDSFGVYIVRRGSSVVYEGRSEVQVENWLRLRAAL